MEAPPREKRARAAFFRAKDAKRAAKQQRKKDKLVEKISGGGAQKSDVEPPCSSEAVVDVGAVGKQVLPFARGLERLAAALLPLRILPTLASTPTRPRPNGRSQRWGWSCHDVAGLSGVAHRLRGKGPLVADAGRCFRLDRRAHKRVRIE